MMAEVPPDGTRGCIDFTPRVRLRLTGPDALRYLNGQVTNDVRRTQGDRLLRAAVCTHKGRLEAEVFIRSIGPESFGIDGPAELRDFLPLRLGKYLIADNAELEDVSEASAQIHFTGAESAEVLRPVLTEADQLAAVPRLGIPGWDVFCPAERAQVFLAAAPALTPAAAEWLRITRRVPLWGRELTGECLPPEARMDEDAIDYHKGCYIGQETVSRLRSVGHINRRLELLLSGGPGEVPAEGAPVTAAGQEAACGKVTSAAVDPVTGRIAVLAFIRTAASSAGREFQVRLEDGATVPLLLSDLP